MRNWLAAGALTALMAGIGPQDANAAASAGTTGMTAYLTLIAPGGGLDGLEVTSTLVQQSSFVSTEGNATASAQPKAFGANISDTHLSVTLASAIGVVAMTEGHALAEVMNVFSVSILNATTDDIIFNAVSAYSLDIYTRVDQRSHESLTTWWNIGVLFSNLQGGNAGEFGRTITCDAEKGNYYDCRNHYDLSDNIFGYGLVLEPGESLEFQMRASARFEAMAVPEPSSIAGFAASLMAMILLGRRRANGNVQASAG